MFLAAITALSFSAAAVVVEGETACPAPAAVQERLRSLVSDLGGPPDVARLGRDEGGLRVTLLRSDGTRAGGRTVAGEYACDELADAVAVMIAAWQTDEAALARLVPGPPAVAARALPSAPTVPARPWEWELGAGGGASLAGTAAAMALVSARLSAGGALGAGARALVSGSREVVLPGGTARWRRALVTVGPSLQGEAGSITGELALGAGLSWLSIGADGFSEPRNHDDLVVGLQAGGRVGWSRAGLRPWLEVGAAFWPVRSVLYQLPDRREAVLPRLEVSLTLGLSFHR